MSRAANKRAAMQMPVEAVDADGQIVQSYETQFSRWVGVRYLRGGESVMQARLQSRSPVILTVRDDTDTRRITSEWKAVIDGREYAFKEDRRPSDNRLYLEFLAEGKNP